MGVDPHPPSLLSLGAVILLCGFSPGPLAAQGALLDGRMEVLLPSAPGPIPVSMDYRLRLDAEFRELGLTILLPGVTEVASVRASIGDVAVPLELAELRPRYRQGTVLIPRFGGDSVTLHLSYLVTGGWEEGGGRVVIPTLAVDRVPEDPHPRTFMGDVRVPEGVTVVESFPTSVVERPDGAEGGLYQVALQAVPAMLVLRVVQGDAPFLTLEKLLDVLVVLTLLAMGVAGIRYLRGQGG